MVGKSSKKLKRDAEEATVVKPAVSSKKQKTDAAVKVDKKLPAAKKNAKPVPKEPSSSEEDSSSDDEPVAKPVAVKKVAAVAPAKKKKVEESESSSDDSDSEEETETKTKVAVPTKLPTNGAVSKKKQESSDSSDDDSSSEEEDKTPVAKKKQSEALPKKKEESSDSDESESDEEDDSTVAKVAAPAKGTPAASKVAPAAASKKKEDSSDSSESDSDSDEDDVAPAKVNAPAKKVAATEKKGLQQNSGPKNSAKLDVKGKDSSSDEDDSSEESSDDEPPKVQQNKPATASKADSSSDEDSSEEESEDEEPSKTPQKKDVDVEMKDATQSEKKMLQTPASKQSQKTGSTGQKTLFAGNLSYSVSEDEIRKFFKDAGKVVDVRLSTDSDGNYKGFGHIEFATEEAAAKAMEKNGNDLLGRSIKLDFAREKGAYTPNSGREDNSYKKGGQAESQTIFVKGFDNSLEMGQIQSMLEEHFGSCGEITRVSLPKDYETGGAKGIAYMDFKDQNAFNKALELDGSGLGDYTLTVNEAKPRVDSRDGGGRSGGRGGGRDSGGRFGGGRRGGRGGDFGGRGGRGGDFGGRGGRGGGGRGGRGRGPSAFSTGKKTTFGDD